MNQIMVVYWSQTGFNLVPGTGKAVPRLCNQLHLGHGRYAGQGLAAETQGGNGE